MGDIRPQIPKRVWKNRKNNWTFYHGSVDEEVGSFCIHLFHMHDFGMIWSTSSTSSSLKYSPQSRRRSDVGLLLLLLKLASVKVVLLNLA